MSIFSEFINMKKQNMFISLYIFLSELLTEEKFHLLSYPEKNTIQHMWRYAVTMTSIREVDQFLNSEAIQNIWPKSKL